MLHLYKQRGMANPGHGGNAVAGIFPQELAVVGNALRRILTRPEISTYAAQHERKPNPKRTVADLATNVAKMAVITPRCTVKIYLFSGPRAHCKHSEHG